MCHIIYHIMLYNILYYIAYNMGIQAWDTMYISHMYFYVIYMQTLYYAVFHILCTL